MPILSKTVSKKSKSNIHIPITNDKDKPFSLTKSTDFVSQVRFLFDGTNILGIPSKIKIISWVDGHTGTVRLRDVTNNLTIVEKTLTNTSPEIIVDDNPENFPTEEAIFELWCKISHKASYIYCSGLKICFD